MRSAIIMTAIAKEATAVREHLTDTVGVTVSGTEFVIGTFESWRVATTITGEGNDAAAVVTERAIAHFKPEAAFFVGVAGGLKDVVIGDVVVAKIVSSHAKGKEADDHFRPRPDPYRSNHTALQQGQALALDTTWQKRLKLTSSGGRVVPGHIVAGEVVVATKKTELYIEIRKRFDNALAVETEGYGFLAAVHQNEAVRGLVIRGISDLLNGKDITDEEGGQEIAADRAAAVAFEILSRLPPAVPAQGGSSAALLAPFSVAAPAAVSSVVEITEVASGRFAWTGAVPAGDAGRLWDRQPPVARLRIAVPPDAPPRLRHALLRLLCHAAPAAFEVEILGHDRWWAEYQNCLDTHMPFEGPDEWSAPWHACPPLATAPPMPGDTAATLARQIEAALDRYVMEVLDGEVRACINGARAGRKYGITVEMELGERLLELWESWKAEMDEPIRRRFLEMLASIHDGDGKPHGLIGVGRQTVERCLVPAAVLALAVAECGDAVLHPDGAGPLKPHHEAPGNLASRSLRGHSCGVRWVEGKPVEHWLGALEQLPWQCRIVILGTVRAPQDLARARQRPIGHAAPDGLLTDDSLSQPIALVFDGAFSEALAKGHKAVEQHLRDVFRNRLREQARYFETLAAPKATKATVHE